MTGTKVTTSTQNGASNESANYSGQVMMVGLTERGPTNRRSLRSLTEYVNIYGGRLSYSSLYDQLATFFGEGGSRAVIARIVGPASTKGTLTLADNESGSPNSTLRVDASGAGNWSEDVDIQIATGTQAGTYKVIVTYKDIRVQMVDNLITPADAVQAFSNSNWVTFSDLGSPSLFPVNQPGTLAATPLSAGNDDRANVTDSIAVNALDQFDSDLGSGAVCIPGRTGSTIFNGIDAHCRISNRRVGLLADAWEADIETLLTSASDLDSEFLGLFTPWVRVKSPSGVAVISPEGYVAAMRARAHAQVGPWRTPMGNIAVSTTLLGLDQIYTPGEIDDLNEGKVSPIKFSRSTYRLYGWRSLSVDAENYFSLKDRDLLNFLVHEGEGILELSVGETIDSKGNLAAQIKGMLVGLVDPIAQSGGLYAQLNEEGKEVSPAYRVITDDTVNPPEQLAQNIIAASVYVRVSPFANSVLLNFIKVGVLSGM